MAYFYSASVLVIILINSCHGDRKNGRQKVNNETWLSKWPCDHRFVIGGGPQENEDELIVDVDDDYEHMPDKHKAAIQWALKTCHENVMLTCTDTYVHYDNLIDSEFWKHQYVGYEHDRYASGGAGFVFGRRAMEVLAQAPLGGTGYGDQWVGRSLEKAGIKLHHDPRFWPHGGKEPPKDFITAHLSTCTGNFDPQWMRDLHKRVS